MGKDNLAMVFTPSFLRCPYTDPSKIFSAAEKEKQFVLKLWDATPKLEPSKIAKIPHTILFEREEHYIPYYSEYFHTEQGITNNCSLNNAIIEHIDLIGKDSNGSPFAVSVATSFGRDRFRTYITTIEVATTNTSH